MFSVILRLFLNGYYSNNKNIAVLIQMCQTIHAKHFMFVFCLEIEVFQTIYCLIVNVAFLTSHNLLFFSSYKTAKKQRCRFSVVFSWKTVQILIFKVEYLENGSVDFNDFDII